MLSNITVAIFLELQPRRIKLYLSFSVTITTIIIGCLCSVMHFMCDCFNGESYTRIHSQILYLRLP